jgi:hypothetical protein
LNSHSNKKSIDELAKKLEEVETKYVTYNTHTKNDGVNFWRGKRIIPLADWLEISNFGEAFSKGKEYQNMN